MMILIGRGMVVLSVNGVRIYRTFSYAHDGVV